ncbi:MAG: hypothetical protein J6X67_02515, partial [Treponema sp.]|nr:hypothetical protein [Treponema sp.]
FMKSNWKSVLGATGSKIWLKIHLRGASEASESAITAAPWIFRQILLVVEPKTDFRLLIKISRCNTGALLWNRNKMDCSQKAA